MSAWTAGRAGTLRVMRSSLFASLPLLPLLPLLLSAAGLAGCAGDPDATPATGVVARFTLGEGVPRFLDVPFPSDLYLEADGTLVDTIPGLDAYVPQNAAALEATLAEQRGFGRSSGAHFVLEDAATGEAVAADPESIPPGAHECMWLWSSTRLIDLDAGPEENALVPCRAGLQDDRAAGSPRPPVVSVLPERGFVLREGHRYAALLTAGVTANGAAIQPSADFAAIVDGSAQGPTADLYREALARAEALAPSEGSPPVVAMAVFTTQSTSSELAELRAEIAAAAPPQLVWDAAEIAPMHAALFTAAPVAGATATLSEWLGAPAKLPDGADDPAGDQDTGAAHDALAAIATAVFQAPNALRASPDGFADPTHGTFARDADGRPTWSPDAPTAKLWITVALPSGPVPASGFPVVILQHGLQGDRSFLLTMANTFARRGWASVAIDAVTFGARAASASFAVDEVSRFAWSDAPGAYAGPDGLVDRNASALAFFGEFLSFGAPRDHLRQAALDIGSVAELVRSPALDLGPLSAAVPGAKLDGSRIAYVGDSFGSVLGALVASVDPRIQAMALNVGGGGLATEIMANGPALATLLGTAGGLTYGVAEDRLGWQHPLVNLLQAMLDPADPLSYADRLVRDPPAVEGTPAGRKSVVLIEALWDELVSNEGSEALAYAAGMPLAAPHVGPNGGVELLTVEVEPGADGIRGAPEPGATVVLVQASPATHGSDLYNASGRRTYASPFVAPFPTLPQEIPVRQPYLGLQAMVADFFASSFAGEVPVVRGFPAPRRDFDDDGRDDAGDADPNDPAR